METKKEALILKVSGDSVAEHVDVVASEIPFSIILNKNQLVTLLCTPSEIEELALGFLLSEGILRDRASLLSVEISRKDLEVRIELAGLSPGWEKNLEKRTISSGCGKGITFTSFRAGIEQRLDTTGPVLAIGDIRRLLQEFRNISSLYLETGGVHSAALSDGKEILFFSEDIGRHNAVDKLIGKAFLKGVSFGEKVLITSGRVTSEIMFKAGRNRFPVVISRAAPSCMAINFAEDLGITLVGFARGDRMNIYSWPNRIRI